MLFKFHSIRTVDDPVERRYRLAQLFKVFENAESGIASQALPDPATEATTKATRPANHSHRRKIQQVTGVSK